MAKNIAGLKEGVLTNAFDIFLWEKFTTKPSVDRGELKMVCFATFLSVLTYITLLITDW